MAAAARYMAELQGHFSDVGDPFQRMLFALASYNGGWLPHQRCDVAGLANMVRNPHNWGVIRDYILRLSQPAYYTDPVVKYGYMRHETLVNYVIESEPAGANIAVVQFP